MQSACRDWLNVKLGWYLAVLLTIASSGLYAQEKLAGAVGPTSPQLAAASYDVAIFKPHNPNVNGSFSMLPDGGFIAIRTTLKSLVCSGYGEFDFEVLGGPAWFSSDIYDVEAKPGNALALQFQTLDATRIWDIRKQLLQRLLAERLGLKVHTEMREMPVFALVVAKGGLKMQEAKAGNEYVHGIKGPDGKTTGASSYVVGNGKIVAQAIPMDGLAAQLTNELGRIVQDHTGLKGFYDFTLLYAKDELEGDSSSPSLVTALQDQLGLKLEPTKAPVEVLVVDHVERPGEN